MFYVLFRKKLGRLRVQQLFPRRADYYREIGYSFLTFVLFSLIGLVLVSPAFRSVSHLTHHRSTNPSPRAAFSFSPAEAVVEGAIILVIPLLIPVHQYTLLAFLLFMTVYNVYGHPGYEIYPKWLVNSRLGRWLNTSTNHNMHHQYFKGNYGLYFRFWDEAFGTTHPHYHKKLAALVGQPAARETAPVGAEG